MIYSINNSPSTPATATDTQNLSTITLMLSFDPLSTAWATNFEAIA
jgi:hypothetical protein